MTMFEGPLTHIAWCWIIERRDGAGLALTSLDQPLTIDGIDYVSSPGLVPKSLRLESGLDPDDFEVSGSLTADGLTRQDMAAGHWDGAVAKFFAIDWTDPEGGRIDFFEGELGEVRTGDAGYSVAIRGPAARLNVAASPQTSPLCRARFGDRHCRVDLAGRKQDNRVMGQSGAELTLASPVTGDFLFGQVRIIDGDLRGFRSPILAVSQTVLTLRDVPALALASGTRVRLDQGCDKRFATCRDRFANARNFRGEPHLPGTDFLTRYPGG